MLGLARKGDTALIGAEFWKKISDGVFEKDLPSHQPSFDRL